MSRPASAREAEIVLFEDARTARLGPIALLRPACELVTGAFSLRERVSRIAGRPVAAALVRPHLRCLLPELGLRAARPDGAPGHRLLLNARCTPDAAGWAEIADLAPGAVLAAEDGSAIAAWTDGVAGELVTAIYEGDVSGLRARPVVVAKRARLLRHSADLVTDHETHLSDDIRALIRETKAKRVPSAAHEGVIVHGDEAHAEEGVELRGPLAIDATAGPVLLRRGARLAPFTLLEGPVLVGEGTSALGGRIAQSYLGPGCLVRGEVVGSVLLGWSNKAHDGFVGHSYLGEWVNLGAMSTTSNLKNTYGPVRVPAGEGFEATERTKVGSVIGDHTKTAIGSLLATGSAIGVGVNLFGATGLAPRRVPSFVWGVGADAQEHDLERCLRTADRAMERRGASLSAARRETLRAAFAATAAERRRFLERAER